jgi:hypothetical protein
MLRYLASSNSGDGTMRDIYFKLVLLALFYPHAAGADTTLTFHRIVDERATPGDEKLLYISHNKIRFGTEENQEGYVIFDANAHRVTNVNHRERSYTYIDESVLAEVASARNRAIIQMKQRLDTLPPNERAYMRRLMKHIIVQTLPVREKDSIIKHITSSQVRTIDNRRCQVIETYRGEIKQAELCVVNRKTLGIPADDYATLQAFQAFADRVAAQTHITTQPFYLGDPTLEQVPVQVIQFNQDGRISQYRLKAISIATIPAQSFAIPSEYREHSIRQDLPSG